MALQPPAGGLVPPLPASTVEAEPRIANVHGLMPREAGALMRSKHTLQLLVQQGKLDAIDAADVKWHIENCTEEYHQGGEAAVHIVTWHARGGSSVLPEGQSVALKVYHRPDGRGGFVKIKDEDDVMREAIVTRRMQRKEVNVLDILLRAGCADSIPTLLGVFQRAGTLEELPLYGYAMTAYRHGSLANYLRRTCDRLVPESEFASFFGPSQLAGHYSRLHDVLRRLSDAEVPGHLAELLPPSLPSATAPPHAPARPPRRGLLLQDISSGNLLLKKNVGDGCVLLFSDPSRAELMDNLDRPDAKWYISATWLWGSMAAHHCIFDEGADVYSTNICMLEAWAVAEGATMALAQLVDSLDVEDDTSRGVTFVRALCTNMLKRHAMGAKACGIVPRIRRELPLSWLMLWAILLGCDDFHSPEELKSGRRHRRPSVADMADVSARLAAIAEQMEGLGGGMTAAALEAPAGAALVQRCVQLYNRLGALTRLDDPDLLPADASLRWVAACFLQQDHQLVAAMKRQGDLMVISDGRCTISKPAAHVLYFQSAVRDARQEAELKSGEEVRQCLQPALDRLLKEYRELQLRVLDVAPPGSELAHWVRAQDAGLPPNLRVYIESHIKRGSVPPLPVLPPEVAEAEQPRSAGSACEAAQPCQPRTAAAAPQPAHTTVPSVAAAVGPAAQLAGAHAVSAVPGQQLHAMQPPQPAGAPLWPTAPVLQPIAPPSALGPQLGSRPLQQAPQQAAAHPLTATQLGQGAVEQPGSSDQPAATLLLQQQLMGVQPTGSQPTFPSSPGLLATSLAMGQALGGPFPLGLSAAFGLGINPRLDITSGAFVQTAPAGGTWQAGTAGTAGAAAGVGPQAQPQQEAAVAAAVMPCQLGSPPKKARLGTYSSAAATAPPASPAALAQPKPHAFCGLFAAPEPAAPGQPVLPPAPVPEWLRLLREQGPLAAAGELGRLGAGGPSSSSPAPGPDAASTAAGPDSRVLSSEGRRMAAAIAAGLKLQKDTKLNYKKADVKRYATALERLLTSQLPPAGVEAQHALFHPIDTAEKLAWFLGWWASKERPAPCIPGLDGGSQKSMACSNNAKAAWTKAVLDAAEEGGAFRGSVTAAHSATMPYAAQALLHRLLVGRPLFAAAVVKEMQEM